MKKLFKRLFALILVLGCLQSLFADYTITVTIITTSTSNAPHQDSESKKWKATTSSGETYIDLGGKDGNDPASYPSGYSIPTTTTTTTTTKTVTIKSNSTTPPSDAELNTTYYVNLDNSPKDYVGQDVKCKDELTSADFTIDGNNKQELQNQLDALMNNKMDGAKRISDPILSTSGQYVFSEDDLKITIHGTIYKIGRFYNSGKNISDNLGKDWYFSLDTRFIRGFRHDIENEVRQIEANLTEAKRIYNNTLYTEQQIKTFFNRKINDCQSRINDYNTQLSSLNNCGYTDHEEIKSKISLVEKLISAYEKRLEVCKSTKQQEERAVAAILRKQESTIKDLKDRLTVAQNKLHHFYINKGYNGNSLDNNFDQNIDCSNEIILIYDEKGTAYSYRIKALPDYSQENNVYPNGSATENLIPGDYSTVTLNPDGTVTWHRKDNQIWIYGTNGLIKRMENLAGVGIDITYNEDKLDYILFEEEQLYKFNYKNNKIESIQSTKDPNDKIIYTYNFDNILDSVTDNEDDTVKYEYNLEHKLTKIIKPDNSYIEIKYDALVNDEKWASESRDEEGIIQTVEYAKDQTIEIDGAGNKTVYTYNKDHNITNELYPDGSERSFEYDSNENIILETYRNNTTQYVYDERGNRKEIIYSDGSKENFEYNEFNQVKYYKDRDGFEVIYDYDEIGNLRFIRKGSEYIFQGQYDGDLLKKSEDALGVIKLYDYDQYGNVKTIETITGIPNKNIIEKYTYDERNRISSYIDGDNNKTVYAYTNKTRTETSSNGLKRTYTYNNRKDLVEIKEEDTITKEVRITKLKYDKKHNLMEVTNPSIKDKYGNIIPLEKYTYRGNNELESVIYSDGNDFWKTEYVYDQKGRLSQKITSKNGEFSAYNETYSYSDVNKTDEDWKEISIGNNSRIRYDYDKWGRIRFVTNGLGETSERNISPAGRTKWENASHGGVYNYEYLNGYLTGLGEENKKQVKTDYYADGTVKSVTDRLGNKTEYFYNAQGLPDRTVSKENTTWYIYDNSGRITGQYITEPDSISYKSNVDSYITYTYKDNGRTVVATYGGLYSKTMKLNAFGEVVELIDGEGNTVKYEYDSLGRQSAVYDGYNKATKYEYNALGLVSKVTYRDSTSDHYEYDHLGNVTKITDAEGVKAEYSYDSAGRLISAKERGSALTEYTYDEIARVTQVKIADTVVEKYEYTPRGRKTTVTDGNGNKYQYNYDAFGRLENETNRLEDSQYYSYDEEGRLNKKKDFDAKTTSYEYDPETRTKTTYFADGTKTIYEYSPSGNLLHVTGETGTISYSYNKAGLVVSQVDHGAGETTYYSYNKAGLKSKVQSDSRTLLYSYGKNSELKKVEDYTTKMTVSLGYDVMGRETKRLYKNGISENTAYDTLGRVILKSETDSYGTVYFAESYVYNSEGQRIMTVTGADEVTLYKYNKFGEIESVYYPYSESLELAAKKEALEAGLYPVCTEYEWYTYSTEEVIQIRKAFARIYKNIPTMQYRGQHVWSEHYTYDNNSNRITKTTQYGTINYTYDDENRLRYSGREKLVNLEAEIGGRITFKENEEIYYAATNDSVSYSTNSLRGTRFTYDKNGNMLSSENLYSVKFFDYNAINRMKLSTVTDLTEHSYTATTYAYDGFGRRTLTQTEGHTANRTLYDGTGFEILRQGTADSNGSFVNYTEAQNRYSPYYPYSGGGYYGNRYGYADYFYYMFFGGLWGFGAGGHGSKNGQEEAPEYLTIENMYPLYANGTVAGTHKEDLVYSPHKHYWNSWTNLWGADTSRYDDYATYKETLYFGTDVLGSVRTTSSYSVFDFGSINYDVFGSPYRRAGSFLNTESLDFGYLGKPYNATTELYDYGFRDYSPRNARFTTVDPIRDGRNWYTYVLNDPVNYIDLWGLETWRSSTLTRDEYDNNYQLQRQYSWEQIQQHFEDNPNGIIYRYDSMSYSLGKSNRDYPNMEKLGAQLALGVASLSKLAGSKMISWIKNGFKSAIASSAMDTTLQLTNMAKNENQSFNTNELLNTTIGGFVSGFVTGGIGSIPGRSSPNANTILSNAVGGFSGSMTSQLMFNMQNGNFLFEGMDSAYMYGTAGGLMVGGVNVCFPTILPGNIGQIIKDQIISTSTEQVIEEKMNEKCTKTGK